MVVIIMLNIDGHVIQNVIGVVSYYVIIALRKCTKVNVPAVLRALKMWQRFQTVLTVLNVWVDDFTVFFLKLPSGTSCRVAVL